MAMFTVRWNHSLRDANERTRINQRTPEVLLKGSLLEIDMIVGSYKRQRDQEGFMQGGRRIKGAARRSFPRSHLARRYSGFITE